MPGTNELIYRPVVDLARMIRGNEVSSEDVVRACLARIEAVNPKLNAVVQVTAEQAIAAAQEADAALAVAAFVEATFGGWQPPTL